MAGKQLKRGDKVQATHVQTGKDVLLTFDGVEDRKTLFKYNGQLIDFTLSVSKTSQPVVIGGQMAQFTLK